MDIILYLIFCFIGYHIYNYMEFRSIRKIYCKKELEEKYCPKYKRKYCSNKRRCKYWKN